MENKFQFGDLVNHQTLGLCVITYCDGSFIAIKNENGNGTILSKHSNAIHRKFDSIKPITHPDTARLNWLEKKMLEDSNQTIVCDGYNGFCTLGNFREHRQPIFENIREAIDHEMKQP